MMSCKLLRSPQVLMPLAENCLIKDINYTFYYVQPHLKALCHIANYTRLKTFNVSHYPKNEKEKKEEKPFVKTFTKHKMQVKRLIFSCFISFMTYKHLTWTVKGEIFFFYYLLYDGQIFYLIWHRMCLLLNGYKWYSLGSG